MDFICKKIVGKAARIFRQDWQYLYRSISMAKTSWGVQR